MRVALEQFPGHENEARGAKAALERAICHKGLLNGMEFISRSESLDGRNFSPVNKGREVQASADGDTVHDGRAAATESLTTTLARAIQVEIAPQHIDQRLVCGNGQSDRPAIQFEPYRPAVSFAHF
jgi:hypothetical protein